VAEPERLQRSLARAGFGSRRACEELIAKGRVTIDGTVATLGDKVDPETSRVEVDGSLVNLNPNLRYYALHKPSGVVTTMSDPQGRRDISGLLPPEGPRVFPVGRLDRDSEGLLLLTNDGELANRLTHPRHGVELDDGPAHALAATAAGSAGTRGAVRIVMGEGRKREVRRMLASVGLPVTRLVRVRMGPIALGGLAPGTHRELDHAEIRALYAAAGM
jgi:23S rRNA pseudouridine2605 synthase